ncbi:BA14K family protein [Bradyrhizobium sp. HKCCYLS3077]|uniref:BA14K family protein n=1 Tax=unclassified Bradyrhizobium TaxID=2631580 RepID=UPI003EBC2912
MPIGITAAGDVVFPFACKDLIDLHRGKKEQTSAATEAGRAPAAHDGSAEGAADAVKTTGTVAAQARPQASGGGESRTNDGASGQPQPLAQEKDPSGEKRTEPKVSRSSPGDPVGCTSFRSYDPKTESYRDFGGRRRPCRS